MAFITSLSLGFSRATNRAVSQNRPPRWTCLYSAGDGGRYPEIDWTGYDPAEVKEWVAREEEIFKSMPITPDLTTEWALIFSPDASQYKNNLFIANQELGLNLALNGVNIVRMCERAAMRVIPEGQTELLILMVGGGMLRIEDSRGKILLAFERSAEADRFAEMMRADGTDVQVVSAKIEALQKGCKKTNMIIGMVPGNMLVTPASFEKRGDW